MTRDELLEQLAIERMTNPWWTAPAAARPGTTVANTFEPDTDLTCARRRREMAADFAALDQPERHAR